MEDQHRNLLTIPTSLSNCFLDVAQSYYRRIVAAAFVETLRLHVANLELHAIQASPSQQSSLAMCSDLLEA